jgi:hypothetical protein
MSSAPAVDEFSYLSVLLSIILGLAITQVLKGFRGLMQARARLLPYWPAVVWSILVLVIAVQSWWAMFDLRHHEDWTFFAFSVVLAQTIIVYLLAALVLPDFFGDSAVDLREHYYGHQRWFFALMVLLIAVSLIKGVVVYGALPHPLDLGFHLVFALLGLIGASTSSPRYHESATIVGALTIGAYIALLFTHLT